MKPLAVIKVGLAILPQIAEVVRAAELMLPGEGRGAEKAEMVRLFVEGIYESIEEAKESFAAVWPILKEKVVDRLVIFYNTSGVFKKRAKVEAPALTKEP